MKHKGYLLPILLLTSFVVGSCGNTNPDTPVIVEKIVSISIKTEPTKVRYYVGDSVNFDGIEIEAKYNTDKRELINIEDCDVEGATTISKGDRVVTIKYQGFSASFHIFVEAKSTTRTLKSVDVDVLPSKVNYLPNETFSSEGMMVNARYSDGTLENVTDSVEIEGVDDLSSVGVKTVKVKYNGKFDTFQIYVRESEGLDDSVFGDNEEGVMFSNMVHSVLSTHNYQIDFDSYIEYHKEDEQKGTYFNINNKAYYNYDEENALYGGLLYQKDQGFVQFRQNVENRNILLGSFYSTSLEHDISDIYDVVIENILNAKWVQDSEDHNIFRTSDYYAIATGCNFTGYASSANLEAPEYIIAEFLGGSEFRLTVNFNVIYYDTDKGEMVKEPGVTTLEVGVDVASNEEIEAYIENPSYIYEAPIAWSEVEEQYFTTIFGRVAPFPTGASYSFYFDADNDYRGDYLYVLDYASGDIRETYRAKLVEAGYVQVGNDKDHYRFVAEKGLFITNYDVYLTYRLPTSSYNGKTYGHYYPNGEMYIEYFKSTETAVNTVARYNKFVQDYVGPNVFPVLTFGDEVTAVTGFKFTDDPSIYKFRQVQATQFHIASYSDALTDFNKLKSDLQALGYTNIVYNSVMKVYNFFKGDKPSYISVTSLDEIAESDYAGVLEIRCQLYAQDY